MHWMSLDASSSHSLRFHGSIKESSTTPSPYPQPSTSSSSNKITPAILFILVILAVIFFVLGLLHLLVRFVLKHRSSSSPSSSSRYPNAIGSSTFQRQLQQLFHLHDSGLDQSFIDALPVFHYKEIMMNGLKEPFDCPVCLCEFSPQDKLRLLPLCSHAFHINCIDTWLLSNSTCPLCRGSLYSTGLATENPVFDCDDSRDEVCFSGRFGDGIVSSGAKLSESATIMNGKRVFSVRLGKHRNVDSEVATREKEEAEASNSNLDARRCYSMGSFQYVVANSDLQVSLRHHKAIVPSAEMMIERRGHSGKLSINGDLEGKKINNASKNESFSVSKVWLWPKKGKFTSTSNAHVGVDLGSPWTNTSQPI